MSTTDQPEGMKLKTIRPFIRRDYSAIEREEVNAFLQQRGQEPEAHKRMADRGQPESDMVFMPYSFVLASRKRREHARARRVQEHLDRLQQSPPQECSPVPKATVEPLLETDLRADEVTKQSPCLTSQCSGLASLDEA